MDHIAEYLDGLEKVLDDRDLFQLRLFNVGEQTEVVIRRYYDFPIETVAKVFALGLVPALVAIAGMDASGTIAEQLQRIRDEFSRKWGYNDTFISGLIERGDAMDGNTREAVIRTIVRAHERMFEKFPKLRDAGFPALIIELSKRILGSASSTAHSTPSGAEEILRTVDLLLCGAPPEFSRHDRYSISSVKSNLAIDVQFDRKNEGAHIQLWPRKAGTRRNQLWQFLPIDKTKPLFRIRSDSTKLYLTAVAAGRAPIVRQKFKLDDQLQFWFVYRRNRGDTSVVLMLNAHYFMALDQGEMKQGTDLMVRPPSGIDAQAFIVDSTRNPLRRVLDAVLRRGSE